MIRSLTYVAALTGMAAIAMASATVAAETATPFSSGGSAKSGRELPPYLQCVPFARELSGVAIFGDAHTWWKQAEGRFQRGNTPRIGAVMAFRPHRNMRLGHVAAVSRVLDSRTVLLSHANWSPINGRRGQIERNVKAVDVSPGNDWSQVRVWYHPLQGLGRTAWPVHGFIYGDKTRGNGAAASRWAAQQARPAAKPSSPEPSARFLTAFASLEQGAARRAPSTRVAPAQRTPARVAQPKQRSKDPFAAALAKYD